MQFIGNSILAVGPIAPRLDYNSDMSSRPEPLVPGTLLNGRYTIVEVLGQGGFGITYLADDARRQDQCVVKELAPPGARRVNGHLELAPGNDELGMRLRARFQREAKTISRARIAGVLPIREAFLERGTAYYATDFAPDAMTLQHRLDTPSKPSETEAMFWLGSLLDTLEALHAQGVLHRDIKPSNVLITPDGGTFLIDFGSARAFDIGHDPMTIEYTPGYAPPEQLTGGEHGPGSDLYSLCATISAVLAAGQVTSAAELAQKRPDLSLRLLAGLSAGLRPALSQRPSSAAALRALLSSESIVDSAETDLERIDRLLAGAKDLRFGKSECPGCGGVLVNAKPLPRFGCPVCREGHVELRKLPSNRCPTCRVGFLRCFENKSPLRICPACGAGKLPKSGGGPLSKKKTYACPECSRTFVVEGNQVETGDMKTTWEDLRLSSGRSELIWECDQCASEFDELPSGSRVQVKPVPLAGTWRELFPEEWSLVAADLDPGAGNAHCLSCGAEYFVEKNVITPLGATNDPYGFLSRYQGRCIGIEDVRWVGMGKTSGNPGLVCSDCALEFDHEAGALRLVGTRHAALANHIGEAADLGTFHRWSRGLPLPQEEAELQGELPGALRDAFQAGEIPFDPADHSVLWRGGALEAGESKAAALTIDAERISLGGLLRKRRIALDEVVKLNLELEAIGFGFEEGELWLDIEPVELTVQLKSGRYRVSLDAEDLYERLRRQLEMG